MAYPYGADDNHTTAYNLFVEGTGFLNNKENKTAIDYLKKCIELSNNFGYKDLLARAYEGVGIAYSELAKSSMNKNPSYALTYSKNAKKYLETAVTKYLTDDETINEIGEDNVFESINNCKKIIESCEKDIKVLNAKVNGTCKQ